MSNTSFKTKAYKGDSTISRAKFGPGMLLQHEDLEQLNSYTRDLSRLLFRSFFGCGVVCGLTVNVDGGQVTVDGGLALNCTGDPIYVPKKQTFPINEKCDPNIPSTLWVILCATTKCCSPRTPVCGCDDEGEPAACTREVDGFQMRLAGERPECACGCDPKPDRPAATTDPAGPPVPASDTCQCADPKLKCYQNHYGGLCGGDCTDCDCVLLARLDKSDKSNTWTTEYSVRRFIRPVLMRDPVAYPPPAAQTGTDPKPADGATDPTPTTPTTKPSNKPIK